MSEFKKYQRTQIAEMRPVVPYDISCFNHSGNIPAYDEEGKILGVRVSISEADLKNGSPKEGDMIARNPKNHNDQWLVAEQYFKENFEEIGKEKGRLTLLLSEELTPEEEEQLVKYLKHIARNK